MRRPQESADHELDLVDRRMSVLIAERHRAVAQSLGVVVRALGGATVAGEVLTCEAALEAGMKAAPDVALVDADLKRARELVTGLQRVSPSTRVIVMTDGGRRDDVVLEALEAGAVGVIDKAGSLDELARALRSERSAPALGERTVGVLLGAYLDSMKSKRARDLAIIETLASAVELRDEVTGLHARRVTDLAQRCLARVEPALACNEEVMFGFMLHDVGKIGVPDGILNKPGPLTEAEWTVMRTHPDLGVQIVEPIGLSAFATDVIHCHHERWDGKGYPRGLAGEEVPLTARSFAVADAFDALTSDRPYRAAMSHQGAEATIRARAGTVFDADIVDLFFAEVA